VFGFRKKNPSIDVEFYERGQVEPFARASTPIDQLPDTFEIETTLHIKGEEWQVSNAKPATKEEFRKTGWLQIYLYKPVIRQTPVKNVLFSLPTISNDIGGLEKSSSLENVFVVHEDDWRQQELVSRDFIDDISKEIDAIRQIYETQRVDIAFKTLHVRSSIPSPLRNVRLTLTDLKARLGSAHDYRGVAFNHVAAVVKNGFAFRSDEGSTFWGQKDENDELAVVCVRLPAPDSHNLRMASAMDSLLSDRNLYFVDWVSMMVIPPIDN